MSGKSGAAYALFREPCKIYNQCFLNGKYQQWQDIYNIFDSFAYMNYFQMPALYERISLWNSLLKFNNETDKNHPLSLDIWNKTEKLSNDIFVSVLEILKPTVHPTCPWWNRKMKNGLSGKEKLIKFFNALTEAKN